MAGQGADGRSPDEGKPGGGGTPWLEWTAAGLGLLMMLGLFAAIGWQALDEQGSSPTILAEVAGITPVAGGYRVEVRARNVSGAAAAQVEIAGTLTAPAGRGVESGRLTFDALAGHSARRGWLVFAGDPGSGTLHVKVVGYVQP